MGGGKRGVQGGDRKYSDLLKIFGLRGRMRNMEDIIADMDLEKKIGQLMMIGFSGQDVTPGLREMIEEYHIGGVIYFARNLKHPAQVADLSRRLQELAMESTGVPLFISADEEGGRVTRVPGMTHFPGAMALGAADSPELTTRMARTKARQLRYLGINFNLAPVLDVNNNPDNPIIGVRSAGSSPEAVAAQGCAYLNGLQQEDVIACGKHFPGHGDTSVDSHLDLPVIEHERERLGEVELKPFRKAIEAGIDSIMTAHIAFPAYTDSSELPATLSREILTALLRKELGFSGLIITDCMEMEGIVKSSGTVEGAVRTIRAGSDQVLISHTPSLQLEAIKELKKAVESGAISRERLDRSLKRILKLKKSRLTWQEKPQYVEEQFQEFFRQGYEVGEELSARAITRAGKSDDVLPLELDDHSPIYYLNLTDETRTPVETPETDEEESHPLYRSLGNSLQEEGFKLTEDRCESEFNLVLMSSQPDSSRDRELLYELAENNTPLVIICTGSPYCVGELPEAEVLLTYDDSPLHVQPLVDILQGRREPAGRLPVELPAD